MDLNSDEIKLIIELYLEGISVETTEQVLFDEKIKAKWDKIVANYKVTPNGFKDKQDIVHYVLRSPIGIKNRDFLQRKNVLTDFPL
jgi:hypothetical protein